MRRYDYCLRQPGQNLFLEENIFCRQLHYPNSVSYRGLTKRNYVFRRMYVYKSVAGWAGCYQPISIPSPTKYLTVYTQRTNMRITGTDFFISIDDRVCLAGIVISPAISIPVAIYRTIKEISGTDHWIDDNWCNGCCCRSNIIARKIKSISIIDSRDRLSGSGFTKINGAAGNTIIPGFCHRT